MKTLIVGWAVNIIFIVILYDGLVMENEISENIVLFMVWIMGILSIFKLIILNNQEHFVNSMLVYWKAVTREAQRSSIIGNKIAAVIDAIYDIFVIIFLMKFGFGFTAGMYLMIMLDCQKRYSDMKYAQQKMKHIKQKMKEDPL